MARRISDSVLVVLASIPAGDRRDVPAVVRCFVAESGRLDSDGMLGHGGASDTAAGYEPAGQFGRHLPVWNHFLRWIELLRFAGARQADQDGFGWLEILRRRRFRWAPLVDPHMQPDGRRQLVVPTLDAQVT